MAKPLVSVIVPTRNSAATLEACLKSIGNQAYGPIELIVVDNHSSDATREIAKRFTDMVFVKGQNGLRSATTARQGHLADIC